MLEGLLDSTPWVLYPKLDSPSTTSKLMMFHIIKILNSLHSKFCVEKEKEKQCRKAVPQAHQRKIKSNH